MPDTVNSARCIIQEWYDDKIAYFSVPSVEKEVKFTKGMQKILDELVLRKDMGKLLYKVKPYSSVPVKMDMAALPKWYVMGNIDLEGSDDEESGDEDLLGEMEELLGDEEWVSDDGDEED